ncbi:hypothetical protein E3N88_05870 [Mikania micrantha]|uniref:Uncharacterized protein n=1 Tax=Mikania micrantha TaxID=192012 RepID=A0A5N6PM56_9ASTR|nr:hypothetical protein E3N88_05870 [Mikania micrantha]
MNPDKTPYEVFEESKSGYINDCVSRPQKQGDGEAQNFRSLKSRERERRAPLRRSRSPEAREGRRAEASGRLVAGVALDREALTEAELGGGF